MRFFYFAFLSSHKDFSSFQELGCSIVVRQFNHGSRLGIPRCLEAATGVSVSSRTVASGARRHDSVRVEKSKRVSNATTKSRRN